VNKTNKARCKSAKLIQEEKTLKNKISVAKFGGSLLDSEGRGIAKILKRIKELAAKDGFGPVVVFSAPTGCTDAVLRIGESYAESSPIGVEAVFKIYEHIAEQHVRS